MSHWMNKALLLAATVVLFALPASALAGTCGVLPFSAGPGVNRGAAPNITALVSSELDIRGGYDLVIAADPEDFEGGDCGASSSCIKSFGQANKHEAVLAGTVASAGDDSYTLTLKLHDGNNASLIRTVQREVPSKADQLMDAVADVIIELVTGEAPAEEEEEDAAASGPLYDDLDFDDLMEDSEDELDEPKRKRGRAAPRNPDRDRDRDYDADEEEDDPFALDDELDALDLSAEEMEKKKRERERQAELERERKAEQERLARERAAEERRRRIAEERQREEEERLRAERAERDRRARIERERREAEEREQMERERREREEEERQARADRERREREAEERAERDRIRQEREDEERRQARAERDREEQERQAREEREEREERERRAEREREQERERSRERGRDRDEDYARDDRDDAMADRVARERERRRNEELDRAERDQDDVDLDDAVALAPATGILIGSAFDDDDGGFTIGPADDDEDDDGGILIGSAADEISFGDDDDDDEPREGMIISEAEEDENPGVRRRREAESGDDRYARARNFNSPSDDREDDDRDYDRSDDRVDDRDDEEDDYDRDDDYRRSSARSRTASRSSSRDRDYDSSERVASRDDSYLSDEYDEYDLDAESYGTTRRTKPSSKVSKSSTRSGNRPWFSGRVTGGYTNYYLHFAQYGLDIGVFPSPRVSVDVQVDFWTLSIRECPECEQEYRTLPSFYLGGSYRFTNLKIVQPYVGGDVGAVVYAIGTLDDGTGAITRRPLMGVAFEVKGGVDFMFTRHFGLGAGLKAGLAYASKIKENVHPDWNPLQFLLNARIAAVVQF